MNDVTSATTIDRLPFRLSEHGDAGEARTKFPSFLTDVFERAWPPPGWIERVRSGAAVVLVRQSEWRSWLGDARALLDDEELARVERRRRPGDRDSLVLAYSLHRLLLSTLLGIAPARVPIGRDEKGCPRLPDNRFWTSLSHGDEHLAFSFSGMGPVGVDIECSARAAELPGILERLCAPREAMLASLLDDPARADWLLALWVRKEAFLKAAGIGMERGMETFEAADGAVLRLPWDQQQSRQAHVQLSSLQSGEDCVAAVATVAGVPLVGHWLNPGSFAPVRTTHGEAGAAGKCR